MNISLVGYNNQAFRGSLIVNNLKNNKVESYVTDKKMDKFIREGFNDIISNHMFVMKTQKECLANLKECVSKFSEILGKNIGEDLKYPSSKKISVMYSSGKDLSKLDVPEYFSIIHSVK